MRLFRKPLGGIDLGLLDAIPCSRVQDHNNKRCAPSCCIENDCRRPFTSCWLLSVVHAAIYYHAPLVVVVCLQAFDSFEFFVNSPGVSIK